MVGHVKVNDYSAAARIADTRPPGHALTDEPTDGMTVSTQAEHDGWTLTAEWSIVSGRPEPTSVQVTRHEGAFVTADALRKLPIGSMLDASRSALTHLATTLRDEHPSVVELFGADLITPLAISGRSQRGRELSDDKLDEVVQVYRRARGLGQPVNEAVQKAFVLSKDGAAKRIGRARRMLAERGEEL